MLGLVGGEGSWGLGWLEVGEGFKWFTPNYKTKMHRMGLTFICLLCFCHKFPEDTWGSYIYLHEWLILMVHVGKYTVRPMDS